MKISILLQKKKNNVFTKIECFQQTIYQVVKSFMHRIQTYIHLISFEHHYVSGVLVQKRLTVNFHIEWQAEALGEKYVPSLCE